MSTLQHKQDPHKDGAHRRRLWSDGGNTVSIQEVFQKDGADSVFTFWWYCVNICKYILLLMCIHWGNRRYFNCLWYYYLLKSMFWNTNWTHNQPITAHRSQDGACLRTTSAHAKKSCEMKVTRQTCDHLESIELLAP